MALFKEAQKLVGLAEGGYQDDPRDSGNFYQGKLIGTNWGISAPVLAKHLGRTPTVGDMKNLSKHTAEEILRINYWLRHNLDKLKNQSVANLLYDGAVNQGSNGTRFILEKALRTLKKPISYYMVFTVCGIEFMNSLNQRKLFDAIKTVRLNTYKKSKSHYAFQSWKNRLKRILFRNEKYRSFTQLEVENMQAWLLEKSTETENHIIIEYIISTGGIDGLIGRGFRAALSEAINYGLVTDMNDLYSKSN